MDEWNKSSMWPLSCYAYFRETPCLPGFADVSPEELRWEAYQAKASGNSQQYLKNVSQLNDEQLKVMRELSNLTKDDVRDMVSERLFISTSNNNVCRPILVIVGIIRNFRQAIKISFPLILLQLSGLKSAADGANSSSQSFFAPSTTGTTTSSLFGNSTPSSSLFGSQKQSSLFASSPPPTTIAQQQTMQTAGTSLFGGTSSQEMLTKQMSTAGLSGQQQLNQAQVTQPSQTQPSTLSLDKSGVEAGDSTKLTDRELEAFKADKFVLGQIPEHAPPEMLCN